jgi:hypothetical protein
MKKILILTGICVLVSLNAYPQLRSLKNKMENAIIDKAIDNMFEDDDKNNNDQDAASENNDSDRPEQKSGSSGLDNSLDDVPQALAQASDKYSTREYRDARTSLRKALKTLDIKVGQQILESLPESVKGLSMNKESDRVDSETSYWAGLSYNHLQQFYGRSSYRCGRHGTLCGLL